MRLFGHDASVPTRWTRRIRSPAMVAPVVLPVASRLAPDAEGRAAARRSSSDAARSPCLADPPQPARDRRPRRPRVRGACSTSRRNDETASHGMAAQPRGPHHRVCPARPLAHGAHGHRRRRSTGSARCPLMLTPDAFPEDDARMLSSACDGIVIHGARHRDLSDLAARATVPVVNACSREHDPCEALAHCLALRERFGSLDGLSVAYVGPAGALAYSLLQAAPIARFELRLACPADSHGRPVAAGLCRPAARIFDDPAGGRGRSARRAARATEPAPNRTPHHTGAAARVDHRRLGGLAMLTTAQSLPDALRDPARLSRTLPTVVELRETHISWVFLAGEKAYKVKKPVRFPFLDYGTLAPAPRALPRGGRARPPLRARACTAASSRSIPHGRDGGLKVAPEYDPRAVDYAVVMRRYDEADDARRAARAAARRRRAAMIDGRRRASPAFHDEAPVSRRAPPGGAASVIDETLATLADVGAPDRELAALARFCRAGARRLRPRARRTGAARAACATATATCAPSTSCWASRVEAVDGVEFDPALRVADVGYDLAFLVMDVARHRRRPRARARARLPRRQRRPGPPSAARLLLRRARARARQGRLPARRAADRRAGAGAGRARARAARARRALRVAGAPPAARLRRPGSPRAASRPSPRRSAAAAGRPVLSSDRIRKLRAGIDPYERAAPSAYGDAESRAVYDELAQRAAARGPPRAAARSSTRRSGARPTPTPSRAASRCRRAPGSSARRRRRCCSSAPRERAARGSISDAGPAIVAGELAVYRGPFQAPGRRSPAWTPPNRSRVCSSTSLRPSMPVSDAQAHVKPARYVHGHD